MGKFLNCCSWVGDLMLFEALAGGARGGMGHAHLCEHFRIDETKVM